MIGLQALHESGCLRGKARPLSIAASLMMGSFTTTQSLSCMRKAFDKHKHEHKNTKMGQEVSQNGTWSLTLLLDVSIGQSYLMSQLSFPRSTDPYNKMKAICS